MRNLSLQYNNNNYYPFGLQHGSYNTPARDYRPIGDAREVETVDRNLYKYKYNGKEYQDELGLDWYDYGARNYDASLGRWMNVDPLESKYAGMSSYNYGFNNPVVFNDPSGMSGEKSGVWIEVFNAQTNTQNLSWVEGASNYEKAIRKFVPPKGFDFTGNYYKNFAYNNGNGTVFGLSDGSTIYPTDEDYSRELLDVVKGGSIYTFDNVVESKIKNIVAHNKSFGIKVDNFGIERQSSGLYKDFFSKSFSGEDIWRNLGGSSARGKWTTRTSAWQDPLINYITLDVMKWSKRSKLFSGGLGIIGDAISFADLAKGGSPLGLLPIPAEMVINEHAAELEKGLFEVAIKNKSLVKMQDWISASKRNTRAPLYDFYQQLRFVYTTDEQVNILNKGQLNVTNQYFSYPNESTTKATLIQVQGNNFSILKTYDIEK